MKRPGRSAIERRPRPVGPQPAGDQDGERSRARGHHGRAPRFPSAAHFRSFTGLAPKASETGNTDRKGQAMSKAGNALLRTTLIRAADWARKQDPQLARIYYVQMTERGKNHLAANWWWPPTWPSGPGWSCDGAPPTCCATSTAPRSTPPRPSDHRRALHRHRGDPQTPAEQQRGEGPSKSPHGTFEVTRQGRGQNEATFPSPHFSPI